MKTERENQKKIISDQIFKITSEIKEFGIKLEEAKKKLKDIRIKKMNVRLQLKDFYIELMKKHEESGYNLNFIIKSLKKLNFAPSEESFPKYIDEESKDYLIKVMI